MANNLEKYIKNFVYSKTHEWVYLDHVREDTVSIKPETKEDCTCLAMFWMRVLRHQNNYPMPKYPYKDRYDKIGDAKIILKVDHVTLTVSMSSGTLTIEGKYASQWFKNTFREILEAYDAQIGEAPPKSTKFQEWIESWCIFEEQDRAKEAERNAQAKRTEEKAMEILDEDQPAEIPEDEAEINHSGESL